MNKLCFSVEQGDVDLASGCPDCFLQSFSLDTIPTHTIFHSSRRSVKVFSSDPLNAVFHPSLLLALGDLLAFTKAITPPPSSVSATAPGTSEADPPGGSRSMSRIGSFANGLDQKDHQRGSGELTTGELPLPAITSRLTNPSLEIRIPPPITAPPIDAQMALATSVTSRYVG